MLWYTPKRQEDAALGMTRQFTARPSCASKQFPQCLLRSAIKFLSSDSRRNSAY